MKYAFTLIKSIALSDIANVTAHGEQGWTLDRFDIYHTDCIFIRKSFEEEFASEYAVMRYIEAFCSLTFGDISVLEAESSDTSILRNKETGDWEMKRDGKVFRYDSDYQLFEEVTNNT
mgnify:CR=1 FL=1